MSIETFDYDLDGHVDVLIGNERGRWHLFKNHSTSGRYLTVNISDSIKGGAALGTLAKVTSCGQSQIQRLGSTSAGHAQSTDRALHFGLGQCIEPATVSVIWTDKQSIEKVIKANRKVTSFGKN